MLKLYYQLLSRKIHLLKYWRYSFVTCKFLRNARHLWIRDEGNTNKWIKTFIPYLTEENKHSFLSKLDKKGIDIGTLLLNKIESISYNNILPYKSLFTPQETKEQENFAKFCLENSDKIPFGLNAVWSYLNYFYIKIFSEEFHTDLQGKDIIDCGWYNGDSSLAMDTYFKNVKNIYCIEPEIQNFNSIKKIIQLQGNLNIIPLNVWLSDKEQEASISYWGAGSNLSIENDIAQTKIHIDTIDHIVNREDSFPWLIKRDIEGYEYNSIVGAEHTIRKYKPILLISIYHTGKDRFEIVELINSRDIGYIFTLRRRNCFHPFADTLLVCYQK